MKRINYLLVLMAAIVFAASCKNVNYKKTKSGLLYKIFPSSGKDSLIRVGSVVKLNYMIKLNDSTLVTTYDKAPFYFRIPPLDRPTYDVQEILTRLKKGDSAITVQIVDSLMKNQPQQVPPNAKRGDRLVLHLKVVDVFNVDSLARADAEIEKKKDEPRRLKEQEAEMAKAQKAEEEQTARMEAEATQKIEQWEKSGEAAKELKDMQNYLASKNISAQKTGKGTFVHMEQEGTGPAAQLGKYLKVKYTGKLLANDSTFESNVYPLQLGKSSLIRGWTEGLQLFKQGGKGTLYIPGFLAYGDRPFMGTKTFVPLKFEIEVLEVSDKPFAE